MEIEIIPALKDNYIYLIHDSHTGATACIDPSEADVVLKILKKKGWKLTHILNTHHHWDHTEGNLELKEATGCKVVGFANDASRIPGITVRLEDNEIYNIGELEVRVIFVPGHTVGTIAYHFEKERILFVGDVLFVMGCGRLFEGTGHQMCWSLERLTRFPPDTKIYSGHEYAKSNALFAAAIEPENIAIQKRLQEILLKGEKHLPAQPSTIKDELETNPFLHISDPYLHRKLGLDTESDIDVFMELRHRKDRF